MNHKNGNGLFARSAETGLLIEMLQQCQVGDRVSYRDMSDKLGFPVTGGTPQLQSARRALLASHRLFFDVERGEGLICGGNDSRLACARDGIKRIHRTAHRKIRVLETVTVEELTNEEKLAFNATASHLGVLSSITTAPATKRLTAAVEASQQRLPLAKTLEAFKSVG